MQTAITRRTMLTVLSAASAQLLFRRRLSASGIPVGEDGHGLTGAPELLNLTLTAMTAYTLRIGIAPVTDDAPDYELGC